MADKDNGETLDDLRLMANNFMEKNAAIAAYLAEAGHPLAPGEPVIQKLRNLVAEIQNYRDLFVLYRELAREAAKLMKAMNFEGMAAFLAKPIAKDLLTNREETHNE